MSYVEKTMVTGEKIIRNAKFHWLYNYSAIILFVGGIIGGFAFIVPFIFSLFGLVMLLKRWTTEIVVTSRRIVYKTGWLSRKVEEMSLNRIEEINVGQTVIGRFLNYGNLVCFGTGSGEITLPVISRPLAFRKAIQEAQVQLRSSGLN